MATKSEIDRIPGVRTTPSKFRARMGDFLGRVQYGKETVVIVTRGKRVAVVCPPENWCGQRSKHE
jgi:prevent-host-death family protein